jgi:histidyl-tRNA synthetase
MSPSEESNIRLSGPITGFADYTPQEQYLFTQWLKKVANVYERFGFTPIHLRPFEHLNALKGDGDTQKQIFEVYRFDTQETTSLALPFDHTVPLALWVAEHAGHLQHLSFPYKRYDLGLSFRGERPKAGRFRAFIQADVDIVGRLLSLSADAECIAAIVTALEALEVGPFQIRINHIGIVKSILEENNLPSPLHPPILRAIDKLDKLSSQEVAAELMKIPGYPLSCSQTEQLIACFSQVMPLTEIDSGHFGKICLQNLLQTLQLMGIDPSLFIFTPGMVRGLAYYTGIVFETLLVGKESFGSVAGGGRYSNLVGDFAKNLTEIEGVGGSVGITRLFDIVSKSEKRTTTAEILVGARTPELMPLAYEVSTLLRKQGHKVDLYSGAPKVKQILGHASSLGVPYALLVMDPHSFVKKEMLTQTQQDYASVQELVASFAIKVP